jgi:hypothetical protein
MVPLPGLRAIAAKHRRPSFEQGEEGNPGGPALTRRAAGLRRVARAQHHHHLPHFHAGHGFHLGGRLQIAADAFQHAHADILVGHFTAAEAQRHFHLVAFLDEALHGAQLHLVVVLVDIGANLHLLDFDDLLLLLGLVLLLLLLVLELAVVQDLAHRGFGVRADFHQIEANGKGAGLCIAHGHHALHFAGIIDQAHLGNANLLVYAGPVASRRGGQGTSGYGTLL